ncbi:transglycosylase domain-containing protein [Gangjinia marincola]|uniref:Transglycosylase domain-containing protein n=1 Tax=Gangjinia marincola TaxID=578463 RepID=A0ABN1MIT2_9FLAO
MAKATKKNSSNNGFKKYIKWFWSLFGTGVLLVFLVFLLASWGVFGPLPSLEELENPETDLATEIFSADGKTLGKYYKENRTPVIFEDLPDHLPQAIIAIEDERFYKHSGIDARGTARAVAYLGSKGGASTVTQQLAKLLFTEQPSRDIISRIAQKAKEWIIAIRLERQYTKEEILTMYLNKFDFIYQAIGIRSASRIYFGKEPEELNIQESASLAAMLKNPDLYNPRKEKFKQNNLNRRNQVFYNMHRLGFISQKEKDSLQKLPLEIDFSPEGHDEGIATYFRGHLQKFLGDWIEKNPKPDGSEYNLYKDGLKIYTTIDSRMQQIAEDAVDKHMSNLQRLFLEEQKKNKTAPFRDISKDDVEKTITRSMKVSDRWRQMSAKGFSEEKIKASFNQPIEMSVFSWKGDIDTTMTPRDSILYYKSFLNTGLVSIEPQTGAVKAWVGGIDFKHFKYEHVYQGKRQAGSTFKPFIYATAIAQVKRSPCDSLPRSQYTIPAGKHGNTKDWTPRNSDGEYAGMMTLKDALANSVNTVTARLIDEVGPNEVLELVGKLGIDKEKIPPVPSISLGTPDLSVYEMVSAYAAFANEGVYVEPNFIDRIEDKFGTVLYQHVPESDDVMSKETAYVTLNLMEGVTQSGSGRRLRGSWAKGTKKYEGVTGYPYEFDNPIAGKTGTTQNNSDGWFMGIVPNLVTGVWVGAEDRAVHFAGTNEGQGATMALPIWGMYMKSVYEHKELEVSKERFKKPDKLSISVNCKELGEQQLNQIEQVNEQLDFR